MLLSAILIPVLLAPFAYFFDRHAKYFSLAAAVFVTLVGLILWFNYPGQGFAFEEFYPIFPQWDFNLHLGVDALSIALIILTGIITILVTLSSWNVERPGAYFFLILVFLGAMVGVFASLNYLWFFIFWEFTLVPMFFHIGIWGAENRIYAAVKFFLYTHLASIFIFLAILIIFVNTGHFDFFAIKEANLPLELQKIIWALAFVGFIVKMPVVPFHTWLPDAHVQAPSPISVILAGLLLKMGAYGLLRWNIELFPEASKHFIYLMLAIGLLTVFHAAFKALYEDHVKRMVAYSSINHMGLVLVAMATLTAAGISAAIFEMVAHALIISLMFMIAGYIHHMTGTWYISQMGSGLMKKAPFISVLYMLGALGALGFPGTAGFIGEVTAIYAAFDRFGWIALALPFSAVLTAGFFFWAIRRMIHGEVSGLIAKIHPHPLPVVEKLPLMAYVALFVFLGIFPSVLFNFVNSYAETLGKVLGG
ncbi:MAG: NADH-quinone oxidoreductase subunit M [Aquificae bacterium]|nr:NADH-quinone oxidoreductase subunit M [Aquificota bacterium]